MLCIVLALPLWRINFAINTTVGNFLIPCIFAHQSRSPPVPLRRRYHGRPITVLPPLASEIDFSALSPHDLRTSKPDASC